MPEEKRKRDFVAGKIKEVFELFGFEPLETPTVEYAALLLGKYGAEADKLVYAFEDRGGRQIALRYDQTVPTARVLAQYQRQLPQYFRRYQIQNVFRADKPQKGRYREFAQCDIDIFNSRSLLADAEILACTYFVFKSIGFENIVLKINDRKILFDNLKEFANDRVSVLSIIQSIDKLDKLSKEAVTEELTLKGLTSQTAAKALEKINQVKISDNLENVIKYAKALGVPESAIQFCPALARGLDYYTGMIFEVVVPEFTAGSLGGGGRYNNLIKQLGGVDVPAVGIAYGFDRVVEAADQMGLIRLDDMGAKALITIFDENTVGSSLSLANELRNNKIKTEVYPAMDKLDKQLKYADKKGIPYAAIIGPDEVKSNTVTIKNMQTGEQKTISLSDVILKLGEESSEAI